MKGKRGVNRRRGDFRGGRRVLRRSMSGRCPSVAAVRSGEKKVNDEVE